MGLIMKQLFWAMIFFICLVPLSVAQGNKKAAVFISDTIKPYYEAVKGLEAGLKDKKVDLKIVEVKGQSLPEFEALGESLLEDGYTYWAAAGPPAAANVWMCRLPGIAGRVYFMVLDPEDLFKEQAAVPCGVSLKIPINKQVDKIISAFPEGVRPGLIFDPEYNTDFAKQALAWFNAQGIFLEFLQVHSRSQVGPVLASGLQKINLLWMIPDPTVISESIIQYIIKQAMEHGAGVVGYNRYFLRQGAAASFVIDYEKMGMQASGILVRMMETNSCQPVTPEFEFSLNQDLIRLLGLGKGGLK